MIEEENFPRSDLNKSPEFTRQKNRSRIPRFMRSPSSASLDKFSEKSVPRIRDTREYRLPTLGTLEVGSLVLGSVALITKSGIRIHILNNIVGFVRSSDIADIDTAEQHKVDNVSRFPFHVGSHVICCVLEIKYGHVFLSLKPSVINKDLRIGYLLPGMLLSSTVLSHEDYGLIVSFNVNADDLIKAFIKYDEEPKGKNSDSNDKNVENVENEVSKKTNDKIATKCCAETKNTKKIPIYSTIYVIVESVNAERKTATCKWPWRHRTPISIDTPVQLFALKPGLLLNGEIVKLHEPQPKYKSGKVSTDISFDYTIRCLDSFEAVIPVTHSVSHYFEKYETKNVNSSKDERSVTSDELGSVDEDIRSSSATLAIHDRVTVRVIYVNETRKTVYVSLLSHIVNWKGPKGHPHKIIRNCPLTIAKTLGNIANNGVLFLLKRISDETDMKLSEKSEDIEFSSGDIGFCAIDHIADKDKKKTSVVLKSTNFGFSRDTIHHARVIEFNYFNRWTLLTLKKSLLNKKFLSPLQLSGGDSVKAEITKIATKWITVKISDGVYGKVPIEHLTDIPLSQIPDRFHVGKSLNLRVLRFDHLYNRLILTAKRTLRKDSGALTQYEQLYVGKELWGYIVRKKSSTKSQMKDDTSGSISIKFYNDLQTKLDEKELEEAERLSMGLVHGSTVKVVVSKVDPSRRKFYVTLDTKKMCTLKTEASAKRMARKRMRRQACKRAFENYTSQRKRKKHLFNPNMAL